MDAEKIYYIVQTGTNQRMKNQPPQHPGDNIMVDKANVERMLAWEKKVYEDENFEAITIADYDKKFSWQPEDDESNINMYLETDEIERILYWYSCLEMGKAEVKTEADENIANKLSDEHQKRTLTMEGDNEREETEN